MNTVKAYQEVIDFIAAGTTPQNVVAFRPSEAAQARVEDLMARCHPPKVWNLTIICSLNI